MRMGPLPRRRTRRRRCAGRRQPRGSSRLYWRWECDFCRVPVMPSLHPVHGGTDSLPDPRYDFSSNANPLGPCPSILPAVRNADVTRYPDPSYTQLRATLAVHHRTAPERIVVGAGASELILRLISRIDGSIQQLAPTFSEYARGARLAGRKLISARSQDAFLRAQSEHPGLGFLCWPNNPTGDLWSPEFVSAAAAAGPLVVDLAYAPPSWVIGRDAVALLESATEPRARTWLAQGIPRVRRWRERLAGSLRRLGLPVRESPATFLLAKVGNGARIAAYLRSHDVRVRDGSSFGLRQWIRLSAQPPAAQKALLAALERAL